MWRCSPLSLRQRRPVLRWQESGVGDFENVTSDLIMLYLGFGFALLWRTNPWFTPTLLLPLVLIQRALKVPQLRIEATYDDKTGLLNHRHFTRSLEIELDRARRFQHPFVVIMADLDLLRNINNTYGHLAGDIVLAGIANVIRKNLREYDIAGRFGGEEFSLVLPETELEVALAAAERLRRSVAAASFSVATSPVPIQATMSFGLAVFPADGRTSSELLHAADLAVYQAKLRGRNRTVAASEVLHSESLASAAPAVLRNAPAEAQAAPTAVTGTAGQNVGSTAFRCAPPRPAPPSS
jgi:diguanylate cyclase (GGDEF)-like protein